MQKENPAFEFWFFFFTPAFLLPGLKAETNSKSQLPAKVIYHKYYKHSLYFCCFQNNWPVRAVVKLSIGGFRTFIGTKL